METFSGNEVVKLFVYDMTKGLAKSFSPFVLGKQLEGVWHTSIVVFEQEYFFGSGGIDSCPPGGTVLGEPDKVVSLGKTGIPFSLFMEYLCSLGESNFKPESYDLFKHNCNNFSQEVANFLTGKSIPQEILDLPNEVLTTPLGATLKSYMRSFEIKMKEQKFQNDKSSPDSDSFENWQNSSMVNASPQQSHSSKHPELHNKTHSDHISCQLCSDSKIQNTPIIHNDVNLCSFCCVENVIDWLLSGSEWIENGRTYSNSKVSVFITVHCLLHDLPALKTLAVDLLYNLSIKGRLDCDAVTELATALLQFFHDDLTEETAYKCLSVFHTFLCTPAYSDISALSHVLGPDFQKFCNSSERNNRIVKCIQEKQMLTAL